jgi:type I restriction enzyme S subunit
LAKGPGVAVGRSGASIGNVTYCQDDFWPHNTCLYVTDFLGNDPRFCYYWLKTLNLAKFNSGSAQQSLNRNYIYDTSATIPKLPEQRAIAAILRALDDKIELNRRMSETLEATARALFKSWFIDRDSAHAKTEKWSHVPFLQEAMLLSGGTPKTDVAEYWNGNVKWASAKDVSQCSGLFLTSTERSITQAGLDQSATQVIPKFATVVVARGATTGRFCMFGDDIAMNQTCYALKSRSNHPFWLNCVFADLVDSLVHAAHGSVFDTITTKTFEAASILKPSDDFIESFEKKIAPLFQRILMGTRENQTLAELRDTLLPKLISGELRIKDAERFVEEVA